MSGYKGPDEYDSKPIHAPFLPLDGDKPIKSKWRYLFWLMVGLMFGAISVIIINALLTFFCIGAIVCST